MKHTSILITFLLFLQSAVFAASGRETARYYVGQPDKFVDKKISLDVTHLLPLRDIAIEGVTMYAANTHDSRSKTHGGTITIAIKSENAEKFVKKYGTAPERSGKRDIKTKTLNGILRELKKGSHEKHMYVDGDGAATALILAAKETQPESRTKMKRPEEGSRRDKMRQKMKERRQKRSGGDDNSGI